MRTQDIVASMPTGSTSIVPAVDMRQAMLHPRQTMKARARRARALASLADSAETDDWEQKALQPGPDELIQYRVIWMAETFSPMHVDSLIDGLRRCGLDDARHRERPSEFVRRQRASGAGTAQTMLPQIVLPSDRGFYPFGVVRSDLPPGVLRAHPNVMVLAGSLTILTVAFLFEVDAATHVDRVLHATHRSKLVEATEERTMFVSPDVTQRDAVSATRRQTRDTLASWMTARWPGAFGSQPAEQMPAVELATHRTDDAFVASMQHKWAWSLGLDQALWCATKWPDIFMREGGDLLDDTNTLRLRAREEDILPKQDENGTELEDAARWGKLAFRLDRSIVGTAALWAAACLLRSYESRLSVARDVAPPNGLLHSRAAVRRLAHAQRQLAVAADARAVAAEVGSWQPQWSFRSYDGGDWERVASAGQPDEATNNPAFWIESAARWCVRSSRDLLDAERRLRDRLTVEGHLIAASNGIRLQRTSVFVALVAVVVAVTSIFIAVLNH